MLFIHFIWPLCLDVECWKFHIPYSAYAINKYFRAEKKGNKSIKNSKRIHINSYMKHKSHPILIQFSLFKRKGKKKKKQLKWEKYSETFLVFHTRLTRASTETYFSFWYFTGTFYFCWFRSFSFSKCSLRRRNMVIR